MKVSGVYGLRNTHNGKWYVGVSCDIHKRWLKGYERLQCKGQKKIYNALVKYGYHAFEKVILEECEKRLFKERETYWISKYNSVNQGYNLAPGGEGGNRPIGIPCSEETKRKIGEANRGRKHTIEARKKMSVAQKGKPKPAGFGDMIRKALTGVPLTEDRRKNISLARQGDVWSDERKKARSIAQTGKKRGPYKKSTLQALEQ